MAGSRRDFLVCTGGLAALLLPGTSLAGPDGLHSFAGTYKYSGGKKQIDELHAAIDEVCEEMNFVFRQFARPKLVKSLEPVKTAEFTFTGRQAKLVRPGIPTMEGVVDGGRFAWKDPEGRKSTVTFREGDKALLVRVKQKDGLSRLNWHFRPGGGLTLRASIDHDKLPKTLKYKLSYKR